MLTDARLASRRGDPCPCGGLVEQAPRDRYAPDVARVQTRADEARATMTIETRAGKTLTACVAIAMAIGVGVGMRRRCAPRPLVQDSLNGWNVLLVTIDTLRADHVGAYMSNSARSRPRIDRLAREGLRFSHAYAHVPLTLPSHATLMTGSVPRSRTAVRDNGSFRLDPSKPTLARSLKGAGLSDRCVRPARSSWTRVSVRTVASMFTTTG